MTDISSQTLHVVAKELAAALNDARAALEAYAEHPDQRGLLEKCADQLHAAHGVLRLVEVYSGALLAEEMEHVTRYLLNEDSDHKRQVDGLDALMRAMVQLPTYLERVLSGGRDFALVLLPLLNDLRSVRGSPLLSEGTLLLLNLKSDQPAQPQSQRPGEQFISVAQWARRLRPRFQIGLLGYIRGERTAQNLEVLAKVAEKLEQIATTQPVFQLWWVISAVLEALRAEGLEGSATLKRLLGQADRQIKVLYELGEERYCEDPPIDLLNNLLYYIARATTAGDRISAVRNSFKLSELLPVDDSIEHERESLSAPSIKLMRTVAAAIKEDLSKVKDVLDIFVRRGGGGGDELIPQLELLKKISDTLGVLGVGELRQRVQQEITELSEFVTDGKTPPEEALIKVAGVLLSVEDSLDDQLIRLILPATPEASSTEPPADQDAEFKLVSEAVLRECIVNMARIKDAVSIAVQKPGEASAQGLDNVPQLLRGITAGLLMLGKNRAVELMDAIGAQVRTLIEPGTPIPDTVRLERVADAIVSLEYYMETLQSGRADPWYMLDNAEICLKTLEEDAPSRVPNVSIPDIGNTPSEVAKTIAIEPIATVALGISQRVPVATSTLILLPEPDSESKPEYKPELADPEFVELFIEEAKEEIASIQNSFPLWDQNPMDLESLAVIRRSFHTLKGSGRMVGARVIAEFGWSIENLLNRIIDKTLSRTPGLMALLRNSVAVLPQLVEALETGKQNSVSIDSLLANAFAYAEGREPDQNAAVAAKPEPLSPETAAVSAASPPAMDPMLHDIYSKETESYLNEIREFLAKRVGQSAPHYLPESVYRAIHTLSGSSKMAEARHGIRITEPLNHVMRKVFDSGHGLSDVALVTLSEAVRAIDNVVSHINESTAFFSEQPPLLGRLHDVEMEVDSAIARDGVDTSASTIAPAIVVSEELSSTPEQGAETPQEPVAEIAEFAEAPDGPVAETTELAEAPEESVAEVTEFATAPVEQATDAAEFTLISEEPAAEAAEIAAVFEEPTTVANEFTTAPEEPVAEVAEFAQAYEEPPQTNEFAQALDESVTEANETTLTPEEIAAEAEQFMAAVSEAKAESEEITLTPEEIAAQAPQFTMEPDDTASEEFTAEPNEIAAVLREITVQPVKAAAPSEEALTPPAEEFDYEIANIYSEEATELLEAAEISLTEWNRDRKDKQRVAELQRQLHTLKGGARMAGISAMGDLSHELETLVIQIDGGFVAADDYAHTVMQVSLDELASMRDLVSNGSLPNSATALIEQIRELANPTRPRVALPLPVSPNKPATVELSPPFTIVVDTPSIAPVDAPPAAAAPQPVLQEVAPIVAGEDSIPNLEQASAPILPGRESVPAERVEMARVDADLLDTMLNNAGEVSIFRARLDQQVNSIDFNLAELARTVTRLKEQLRGLEIETEAQVLNRHQVAEPRRTDFDPLELDRYSLLQEYSRALAETSGDVASIQVLLETLTREAQDVLTQQSRVITELQNSLMRTRMVPFQRHVQRLTRLVRQTANDTGKRAELVVQGAAAELDRQMLERMVPPLEHMLRNAVVHGIETPERRTALGKPDIGRISVSLERDGAEVVIVVNDDGAGISVKLIREKAIALGLTDPQAKLTDEEAVQLILEPGFSTMGHVTQAAGRGVGMDVVATEVKKLGGGLFIETNAGRGSRFTIRLPFTLAISQALIVRVGDEAYALPLATVEGVVRLPRHIVARHLGKDAPMFEYGGQKYRFQQLGSFVGLGPTRLPETDASLSVALIRAGEHSTALVTDELIGSREIVVKSLGPQISAIRGIAGATILGDGRVVIILDMGSLVRSEWRARPTETMVLDQRDRRTFALVVDDSITVRRVTQRLLERNGMRVLTAKDGMDAVSLLQENLPDIILLDIEMPRMDGYEVAAHVRSDPRLKDIPIVMITSRVSEKHRSRAIELGVDDYLGKPYQESQLLDAIEPLVNRRQAVAR